MGSEQLGRLGVGIIPLFGARVYACFVTVVVEFRVKREPTRQNPGTIHLQYSMLSLPLP
jgi:hypothetical protein